MYFDDFFRAATGFSPHGYQRRIAQKGLPAVIEAPTGTGKTGVVLAWLWRRLYGPDRAGTPRRLMYALPMRSLVEQTSEQAKEWLERLGLTDQVALHVVMGGRGETQGDWRKGMDSPAIVIGTVDSLVSKALNRGYGIGRAIFPIDFALSANGSQWVIDEIQLCRESTTTLRQLAAFVARLGTAEPFGLTCMSATVPEELLATVDNPDTGNVVRIQTEERTGALAQRLGAARTIRALDVEPGQYAGIASAAVARHRPGTLTLVVLNTVDAARQVHKVLAGSAAEVLLLHSRFRSVERDALMTQLKDEPGDAGRIVVATQVVEAGLDLDAALLVTEAAPWPSLVQRAGRCNRSGTIEGAELCWVPPAKELPYEQADIDASTLALRELEGQWVTGEDLLGRPVDVIEEQVAVLRQRDFLGLFDTSPDLNGADLDISRYIRDSDDLDVQLAWANWAPELASGGAPPYDARIPAQEYRCRVPLGELAKFAKRDDVTVWRLDQVLGRWVPVTSRASARPGEVLLTAAASGGYRLDTGFDVTARGIVPGCPDLARWADPATGAEDAYRADSASVAQAGWVKLDRHSADTLAKATELLASLAVTLPEGVPETVLAAAHLHDLGKAHPIWQDALCDLAPVSDRDGIAAGRPWAKSGVSAGLRFRDGVSFRHELASLLLLDGPLRGLLDGVPDPDLARYLVLAHHGKLRVQVRDPGDLAVVTRVRDLTDRRSRPAAGRDADNERAPEADADVSSAPDTTVAEPPEPGPAADETAPVPPDDEQDVTAPSAVAKSPMPGLMPCETVPIPALLGRDATQLVVDDSPRSLGQFALGDEHSWTRTVQTLLDRYGPFQLAYLETLVRVADWRASAAASPDVMTATEAAR